MAVLKPTRSQRRSTSSEILSPWPVGHDYHRGVPVAPAVALGRRDEPLDLALGQVFAGAQVGVGKPLGRNCSSYGGWRDYAQVRGC